MYWGIFYNSKNNFKINKLKITRTSTSWKSDGDILHKHNCLTILLLYKHFGYSQFCRNANNNKVKGNIRENFWAFWI